MNSTGTGARCDNCRRPLVGEGHRTTTRTLCGECFVEFQGAAAGVLAGGGVPGAISTAGWFERVRTAIGRDEKAQPGTSEEGGKP